MTTEAMTTPEPYAGTEYLTTSYRRTPKSLGLF